MPNDSLRILVTYLVRLSRSVATMRVVNLWTLNKGCYLEMLDVLEEEKSLRPTIDSSFVGHSKVQNNSK